MVNSYVTCTHASTSAHDARIGICYYLKHEDPPRGPILFAPCDVFLDEHSNAVQPDIIFISAERESIIRSDAIHGVPDLIIEILSTGNSQHDFVTKRALYEKFRVKEYWIVTPETKETIGFLLKDGSYAESGGYTGKIHSVFF